MATRARVELICCLLIAVQACSSASTAANSDPDFEILFIGNSHSSSNDLPEMLALLLETGLPGKTAYAKASRRWAFLDERIGDGATLKLIESRDWTHVVLQAQKYSTTGRYHYPIDAALEWIRIVRERQAVPVLFPEWPRRGNAEEGQRIYDLHRSIAAREPACVAPIGPAWDLALAHHPELRLHAGDGNHANRAGSLLTAYVLYELISRQPANSLPNVERLKVDAALQEILREAASNNAENFATPDGCQRTVDSHAS